MSWLCVAGCFRPSFTLQATLIRTGLPAHLPKTRCLSPRVAAVPIPPKKLKQGPRLVRIGRWGGWPRFSHSGRPNHDVLHACGQHAFAFLPPPQNVDDRRVTVVVLMSAADHRCFSPFQFSDCHPSVHTSAVLSPFPPYLEVDISLLLGDLMDLFGDLLCPNSTDSFLVA
ncbi:hypothetical protein BDQ94DRAFT_6772 [Aspergillus welwitschiae]|uniref:Uncharacterized protein n=1 Tax=Aspergillus welwitschiae TaxID=1341132 RepID=A0A3F3QKC5_9EURO|nr:hypothetical protein BDQ94DRAFT_6772 [Aspergillus welwitschiae]RDH39585.1 hypothetical protein BDQ94DRAFT_6772 [Aspergillus welwitschiae]